MSAAVEPYERLATLAEEELALVTAAELPDADVLEALLAERDRLVAALPADPPAAAAHALARAAALQERTTGELAGRLSEARRELDAVGHGRRVARGYGGATPQRGALDLAG
ncbi:hypothetical protein VSS74_21895 [Conexibacter stalactiti]|uniref:Flagellar protein FliT n=1 Tax=Conexibacter stalactiti TaxID=1940611 RepID=A0ABU4HUM4_9ACTN|nr:hypothetical protein [Conexibacter stalactiti]MDW5597016.1 hypothetical protein [Conexibacter stalactiti]MEC5037658.1 hypothetical protein [Conexibacter stalactiti]